MQIVWLLAPKHRLAPLPCQGIRGPDPPMLLDGYDGATACQRIVTVALTKPSGLTTAVANAFPMSSRPYRWVTSPSSVS